jgi:CRP/FNR family transcriptional regulator, cyclic AMP receptor protein
MQTMKFYKKDQVVATEGIKENRLFILVDGRIGVFKGSLKVAEFSDAGTILGEMAVILKQPRTASLKALEDTNIIVFDVTSEELIGTFPDITLKIMKNLAERLTNTTKDYWKLSEKVNAVIDLQQIIKKWE